MKWRLGDFSRTEKIYSMDIAMAVEDFRIVHSGLNDVLDNSIGGFGIFFGQIDDDKE